ncbi:deaminated glutathione amidase [Enterobacteriaceae bacterium 4M9]|nr:deaminated glutathione amidase [Enterobacteriaceae bacterium 4M9]
MRVAVGQFAVTQEWQENLSTCQALMRSANAQHADLLVLPEALLARADDDPDLSVKSAQALDGAYVHGLLSASRGKPLTTVLTIHVPTTSGRATNTLLAIREGKILARYEKLHLYDAFRIQESRLVDAGIALPPLIEVAGMKVGLMTCYDLRFPELALSLALAGAELLALPAAWVRGAHKERHWETLLAARALDTTCWIAAAGECGNKNIGHSRVVDPFGITVAGAAETPALIVAEASGARVAEVRAQLPVLKNRRFATPRLN